MIVGKMKKQSNDDKSAEPYMILGSLQTHAVRALIEGGGTLPALEQQTSDCHASLRCIITGQIWKSKQNGQVYDPDGLSPCICVGHHSGVEPKIIVYKDEQDEEDNTLS